MTPGLQAQIDENTRTLGELQVGMQRIKEEIESVNERQNNLLDSLRQSRTYQGVLRRWTSAWRSSAVR